MSDIVEKIKKIDGLYHAKGCSVKQLNEAESELNIVFPEEFIEYVREFGAISFFATEWTGLNVNGHLNVVEVTKKERNLNCSFPRNCFVLENQGVDGILIICNEKGEVFSIQFDNVKKIYDSISEYLDECIARKNRNYS